MILFTVMVKGRGATIGASANNLMADKNGKMPNSIGSIIQFANFPTVSKCIGNVTAFIARNAFSKQENGSFVVSEEVAEEAIKRVDAANAEIEKEVQAFIDHYDDHKASTEETIRDYCTNTRKFGVKRTEKIVSSVISRFPSPKEIAARPKVYLLLDYKGSEVSKNEKLKKEVENSQNFQKLSEYKNAMLKSFAPIWKHLGNMLNQVSEDSCMSERTLNAYRKATDTAKSTVDFLESIENIEIDNIEISSHELEALTKVAPLAINSETYAEQILFGIFKEAKYLGIESELDEIPNYSFDELYELSENSESLRDMASRIAENEEETKEGEGE